jgi:hypothetical protein
VVPSTRERLLRHLSALMALAWLAAGAVANAQKSPGAEVARRVDASLAAEVGAADADQVKRETPIVDDEAFLRRASLDLIGDIPTPEEVTAFVLDPSSNKREAVVDRLLADKRFGENWGHYFRDVILYRRSDDRAQLAGPSIQRYLAEQFNGNVGWDKIARDFIAARGDVREAGATGIIMAQMGQPPEVAGEMSRIFLGVQIQCAQCHDHPTDRWKRTQFHELVAFFPRIAVQPVKDGEMRSFAVVSRDREPRVAPKDGKYRGQLEHFMPDLSDPSAKGKEMKPIFFLTGKKLETGAPDVKRRETLAEWFTAKGNLWFARAFVNRIWAEMVGRGFYEPIDDLGPDRTATSPKTLDVLSIAFANHDYDVKWLMRTIAATNAYQHISLTRGTNSATPFAAATPQPLRADQLYDALRSALAVDDFDVARAERFRAKGGRLQQGARFEFNRTFGFDPSLPRDDVAASIPQALMLMNGPMLQRAMSAKQGSTLLGKLLAQNLDDREVIGELYLRCLAREPKPDEVHTCLAYVGATKNRSEAYEDILWTLLNSTEFSQRK